MDRFEDTQGKFVADVSDPVNCDDELTQAVKVPFTTGKGLTLNIEFA